MRFFLLLVLWMMVGSVWADNLVKVGVLAYRPKAQTLEQWQPFADYLSEKLQQPVALSAYNFPELNEAVEQHQVDVVLTNPAHYIVLRHHFHLSAPIASMAPQYKGLLIKNFGGVIFARADDTTINTLQDLANKRIAAINTGSLGGYQMQAYEIFKAYKTRLNPNQIVVTPLPHDNIVNQVLQHQADVGFVRTGVLESLAAEGKLDLQQIKVINPTKAVDFPHLLSTQLYPEWPVAVTKQVSIQMTKKIAVAILSLPMNGPVAKSAGIYSFISPEDYSEVESLLRDLRQPPFDQTPNVTLNDLWQAYTKQLLTLGILSLVVLSAGLSYLMQNKRVIRAQKALLENETRFKDFFNKNNSVMLLIESGSGKILDANAIASDFYGYSRDQLKAMCIFDINTATQAELKQEMQRALNEERNFFKFKHRLADGSVKDVEVYSSPILINGETHLFTIIHDTTERIRLEKQLQLYANVFTHAREGILITDAQANIIDVNEPFCRITGYQKDEVLGKNPRFLNSGKQGPEFYRQLWQELQQNDAWSGEIWNRKKTGDIYAELLTISSIRNEQGQVQNYVALFSDITPQKFYENELKHIAHHDVLTGLPNRALLTEKLNHAMSLSLNNTHGIVLLFIDLDGFKAINDTYGHDIGDELLKIVTQRMQDTLRESDTLARIGGDEFIAILDFCKTIEDVTPLLARLLTLISQEITIQGQNMQVSASIGVSFFKNDLTDADLFIHQADQAMYQAKQSGKNRFYIFDPVNPS